MSVGDQRVQEARIVVPDGVRDPRAATRQLRYVGPNRVQIPDWDADRATKVAYYSSAVAFRCCQIIANDIAALPFRAGADPDKPHDFNKDSPLAKLLGPPPGRVNVSPLGSARKFWAWMITQRLIAGRMAAEIEEASPGGRPVALWPLVAAQLREIPSDGGNLWFKGFEYGKPADPVRLTPSQVFYGLTPHQSDPRQPESALQAAHLDLSVQIMLDRFQYAFLMNNAMPAAIVSVPEFAEKEDFEKFQRQLESRHQGPDNAGRVMIHEVMGEDANVAESLAVQVLGTSPKDAQQLELYKLKREQIAIALGVPYSKLDASGRTFDNAAQEDITYHKQRILPLLSDLADEVNMSLAPRLGSDVGWFDISKVDALKPLSRLTTRATVADLLQIADTDEVRQMFGLPPQEGATSAVEPGKPVVPAEVPPSPVTPALPPGGGGAAKKPKPERRIRTSEERAEQRRNVWHATDKRVSQFEAAWKRAWVKLFERQRGSVIGRLKGNRGHRAVRQVPVIVEDVFSRAFWHAETQALAHDLYESVVMAAGIAVVAEFSAKPTKRATPGTSIGFDVSSPTAQLFIQARANQLAGQVTDTTYDAIKDALTEGVTEGEGIPELAARIVDLTEFALPRAETIARTEVIGAYNGATDLAGAQLPASVVAGREWIATDDDRTRASHADADGSQAATGEPFDVGGEALQYPGDPNGSADETVNCRCTIGLLTPDEFDAERSVSLGAARALLELTPADGGEFDERAVRVALSEVA